MNFNKPFWATVFRDRDGTASSSRLMVAAIVGACLGWVSYLVVKTGTLPDLALVGQFITTTSLPLYGLNRVTSAASDLFAKKSSGENKPDKNE